MALIIKTWRTKDIWFKVSDRKIATKTVNALLSKGWEFQDGAILDDGLVYGEPSLKSKQIDGEQTEEIQMYLIE